MCGIFGYVGATQAGGEIILDALRKLEYRGYDSWGDAVADVPDAKIGFGHTRWATHGGVTDENAHPHLDCTGRFAVIHNGIIENYRVIKDRLIARGHLFHSETDTEIVAHMIEDAVADDPDRDLVSVVREVFAQLRGLNAIIVMDNHTHQLTAVKNVSPLVLGEGDKGFYLASDALALIGHVDRIHYLEDGQVARITADGVSLWSATTGATQAPNFEPLTLTATDTSLGIYPHFMIKEIHEQPDVLRRIGREYTDPVKELAALIRESYGAFLVGSGTASYAALSGSYLFSRIARRHVNFTVGSEFKYQEHFITDRSLVIALSQSGETADVIESVMAAKQRGAKIAALVNVRGSTLDRLADFSIPLGAGPEQCVLSTKAYTAKIAILLMVAHELNGSLHVARELLWQAVDGVEQAIAPESANLIRTIAASIVQREHAFIIGRGLSYPTALEAALKIKEVSYMHAEGFAGGELKHGVIALVEKGTPSIVFSPLDETRDDILSGAMEMRSRGGMIIGVSPERDRVFDAYIPVADVGDASPIVNVIPAQLLGYELALLRGHDPDKPRNLAKSVTVK